MLSGIVPAEVMVGNDYASYQVVINKQIGSPESRFSFYSMINYDMYYADSIPDNYFIQSIFFYNFWKNFGVGLRANSKPYGGTKPLIAFTYSLYTESIGLYIQPSYETWKDGLFELYTLFSWTPVNEKLFQGINAQTIKYTMPEEIGLHEGTWLQWPHNFTYPPYWREDLEPTWIEMTRELATGEKVHIIAYNTEEKDHIVQVLTTAGVPLTTVDFYVHPNNDVWVRDNGPIFVFDNDGFIILIWHKTDKTLLKVLSYFYENIF